MGKGPIRHNGMLMQEKGVLEDLRQVYVDYSDESCKSQVADASSDTFSISFFEVRLVTVKLYLAMACGATLTISRLAPSLDFKGNYLARCPLRLLTSNQDDDHKDSAVTGA